MGTDIWGWIEAREPGERNWRPIMEIDWLAERAYDLFRLFFGVRGDPPAPARALAPERGLPADATSATRDAIAGASGQAATWILWREIEAIDWRDAIDHSEWLPREGQATGWEVLFKIMEALASRCGDDGVRLVVWFDSLSYVT